MIGCLTETTTCVVAKPLVSCNLPDTSCGPDPTLHECSLRVRSLKNCLFVLNWYIVFMCPSKMVIIRTLPIISLYIPRYAWMADVAARLSVGQSGGHPLHLIIY